jgi:hypothetical protein
MVVNWVDIWIEVCAVVTTVVWVCTLVCTLVCVVCTDVTAAEGVVALLDPGGGCCPGGAGGDGGAGGVTVASGFSDVTPVSCPGTAGFSTIGSDGAVEVGRGSAANGGVEVGRGSEVVANGGAAGGGGGEGGGGGGAGAGAAGALPSPTLPGSLPLPTTSSNVIPPACTIEREKFRISPTYVLCHLPPCLFPAGVPVEALWCLSRQSWLPLLVQAGRHLADDGGSCGSHGLAVTTAQPSSLELGWSPSGTGRGCGRHSHVRGYRSNARCHRRSCGK